MWPQQGHLLLVSTTNGQSQRSWSLRSKQVQGSWQKCSPPGDASSLTLGGAQGAGPGWASNETQVLSPAQSVKWSLVLLPLSLCFKIAVLVHDALELGSRETITKLPAIIYVHNELKL